MAKRPLIVLRADASPSIGGGHVMRGLAIAAALRTKGAKVMLASGPETRAAVPRMARSGFPVVGPEPQPCAAVLIDGYTLGIEVERAWAATGAKVVVMDDAPSRPHACAALIDPVAGRTEADYRARVPVDCTLHLGPAFAPMDAGFAARREESLKRRETGGTAERVLVSLGLTDAGGLAIGVAQGLLDRTGLEVIDVAIGAVAPSASALADLAARSPRLRLHVDTDAMPELTAAADIAVGAAGVSTWERCALGLPGVVLTVAANQADNAHALEQADAALVLDGARTSYSEIVTAVIRLMEDGFLRNRMSQAAAGLCDGQGAKRIADVLLALGGL